MNVRGTSHDLRLLNRTVKTMFTPSSSTDRLEQTVSGFTLLANHPTVFRQLTR